MSSASLRYQPASQWSFAMNDLAKIRTADMLNKVPEVTLAFWVIKILSTTVGETGAD